MSKRRNSKQSGSGIDPNGWMSTMSDLVFLLITFFVLLLSMSSLDAKRLKKAFGFFDDAIDALAFTKNSSSGSDRFMEVLNPLAVFTARPANVESHKENKGDLAASRDLLDAMAKGLVSGTSSKAVLETLKPLAEASGGQVSFQVRDDGYAVTFPGRLIFEHGNAEVGEEGRAVLTNLGTIVKLWGGEVDIIASWTWHEGPLVLAAVTRHLEQRWVRGKSLHPQLRNDPKRTIQFILRKREVS